MNFKDGVNLFSKDAVFLLEKDAQFCCAMSKMTVKNELESKGQQYDKIAFVELLESVGRVAEFKFKGTPQEGEPLHRRIEYVLDELLPKFGVARKDVHIEEEFSSSSDD